MKQLLPLFIFSLVFLCGPEGWAQLTIDGPETICTGTSAPLTATNCTGTLKWSTGETTPSITVSPTSATTYYVTCTVGGTVTTGSLSILVVPGHQLNSIVGTCFTDQTTLSVKEATFGGPLSNSLRWEKDGVLIPDVGSNSYDVTQPGTYTVRADWPTTPTWTWQNLLPDGDNFNDVYFANDFVGVAVGDYGKIVRTTDSGETWTRVPSFGQFDYTSVHFVNSTTGWITGQGGQLLKTTDAGLSWFQVYLGSSYYYLTEIFFTDPDHGWITDANSGSVLRTINGGLNWQASTSEVVGLRGAFFTDNNNGWVVGSQVRKTTDGGVTWSTVNLGSNNFLYDVFFINSSVGWIVGSNNTVYKTTDGGSSWVALGGSFPANTSFNGVFFIDENNGIILSTRGIYKTSNGGNSWNLTNAPTHTAQAVFMRNPSRAWVAGQLGRLLTGYSTPSSYGWKVTRGEGIGLDPEPSNVYPEIDFVNSSIGWAVNGRSFLIKTTNGGKVWTNTPLKDVYDVDFIDANTGYAAAKGAARGAITLHKSTDGGNSWNPIYNFPIGDVAKIQFINSSVGWAIIGYNDQNVYSTTNGGFTWHASSVGFNTGSLFFLDASLGWVSGANGRVSKTIDGGITWTPVNAGTESTNYTIDKIYFKNNSIGWLTGLNTRKTTDGGLTWSANVSNGSSVSFRSISFADANQGIALPYYRSPNGGYYYYRTTDGGITWLQEQLPSSTFFQDIILSDAANGWITNGKGAIMHYAAPIASCSASITLQQSPPAPLVTASTHNALCEGESITLTARGCTDALSWSDGSTSATITVTPYSSTTYTAFCGPNNGCQGATNMGIAVIPKIRLDTTSAPPCNRPVFKASNFWPGIDLRWMKDGNEVAFQASGLYRANNTYPVTTPGTYMAIPDVGAGWSPQTGALGIGYLNDVDFANPSLGIAVGESGTILKSSNGGTSWKTLSSGTVSYLSKVEMITSEVAWVLGFDITLKTTDGGITWVRQNMDNIGFFSNISFFDANIGWAINAGDLYHTTDGGTNWTSQKIDGATNYLSIHAVGASTAWVTTYSKVFKTTDAGTTWIEVNVGNNGQSLGSAAYFTDADHGWVAGSYSPARIYHTTDGGVTWNTQALPQLGYSSINQIQFTDNMHGWAGGNNQLLTTDDGGNTWFIKTDLTTSGLGSSIRFHFISQSTGFTLGNGLVALTTDGAITWRKASANLLSFSQADLMSVHFIDNEKGFVVGRNKLLLSTTNGGKNWSSRKLDFAGYSDGYDVFFVNDTHGWILSNGNVLRTTDGGLSWNQSANRVNAYAQIFFVNTDLGWAPGYGQVSKTTDGGITWTEQVVPNGNDLRGVFFIDSNRGWVTGSGSIFSTTDGGSTWVQQYTGNYSYTLNSVHFTSPTEGWVTGAPHLLHTTDGGNTWQVQTLSTISSAYFSKVQFINENIGFVRSNQVVYATSDKGVTWKKSYPHGNLTDMHFTDATHGWSVGNAGILAYHPAVTACPSAPVVVTPQSFAPLSTLSSGIWDSPSVWSCGQVPTSLDAIRINAGHTITLPEGYMAKAKSVELRGNVVQENNTSLQMGQE